MYLLHVHGKKYQAEGALHLAQPAFPAILHPSPAVPQCSGSAFLSMMHVNHFHTAHYWCPHHNNNNNKIMVLFYFLKC